MVSGNGWVRCSGLLAMSTVVWPARFTAFTSAPLLTRYFTISLSPRAAACCRAVKPSASRMFTSTFSSSRKYFAAGIQPSGTWRCCCATRDVP